MRFMRGRGDVKREARIVKREAQGIRRGGISGCFETHAVAGCDPVFKLRRDTMPISSDRLNLYPRLPGPRSGVS